MVNIIMHGCCGAMGQVITRMAAEEQDIQIVAGIDLRRGEGCPYPVFAHPEECRTAADVVIDFSNASAVDELLDWCADRGLPVVLCTTGLSEAQLNHVKEASGRTAVLRSANMSLGINLLFKLVREAAQALADNGFDIEVVEKHHHRKVDAPSGTAICLADAANEAANGRYHYVYDRQSRRAARDADEIGIMSVRGGNIVGDHDVLFCGEDEVITLSHQAFSRNIFASGALSAARFMAGKKPGLYTMEDVIG